MQRSKLMANTILLRIFSKQERLTIVIVYPSSPVKAAQTEKTRRCSYNVNNNILLEGKDHAFDDCFG